MAYEAHSLVPPLKHHLSQQFAETQEQQESHCSSARTLGAKGSVAEERSSLIEDDRLYTPRAAWETNNDLPESLRSKANSLKLGPRLSQEVPGPRLKKSSSEVTVSVCALGHLISQARGELETDFHRRMDEAKAEWKANSDCELRRHLDAAHTQWKSALEAETVNNAEKVQALGKTLGDLASAVSILRTEILQMQHTRVEAPSDYIMSARSQATIAEQLVPGIAAGSLHELSHSPSRGAFTSPRACAMELLRNREVLPDVGTPVRSPHGMNSFGYAAPPYMYSEAARGLSPSQGEPQHSEAAEPRVVPVQVSQVAAQLPPWMQVGCLVEAKFGRDFEDCTILHVGETIVKVRWVFDGSEDEVVRSKVRQKVQQPPPQPVPVPVTSVPQPTRSEVSPTQARPGQHSSAGFLLVQSPQVVQSAVHHTRQVQGFLSPKVTRAVQTSYLPPPSSIPSTGSHVVAQGGLQAAHGPTSPQVEPSPVVTGAGPLLTRMVSAPLPSGMGGMQARLSPQPGQVGPAGLMREVTGPMPPAPCPGQQVGVVRQQTAPHRLHPPGSMLAELQVR